MNVNDTAKVSRVEVIDDSGRAYTVWKDGIRVWCDLQDDGRTLKVFIDGAKRDESSAGTTAPDPDRRRPECPMGSQPCHNPACAVRCNLIDDEESGASAFPNIRIWHRAAPDAIVIRLVRDLTNEEVDALPTALIEATRECHRAGGDSAPWKRDDQATQDLLDLVGVTVPLAEIGAWCDDMVKQAEEWAGAVHLRASDNDVRVPKRPIFVPEPYQGGGDD